MMIAFDLTQIPVDKTGVGIYALHLVEKICRLNREDNRFRFVFFVQDDDRELIELIETVKTGDSLLIPVKSKRFRKLFFRFIFEQVLMPRRCRKLGVDVIFSFHYTMPYFTSIRRVVMVPDMTFYLFPQLHQWVKVLYFRTLIPLSLRRAHKVITISQSTRNDILERFPRLDSHKIQVTYLGVDLPAHDGNPDNDLNVLTKFGLQAREYYLFVGTLEPRKNIPGIVRAFDSVRKADPHENHHFKLVIVGKKGWFYNEIFQAVKESGLEDQVVFTGYTDESEKQALLRQAFLFIYPSFYEGFGIPVIEAMGAGVPVITSNVSSLPEVAGDAALIVPPQHWHEIASAILKLQLNIELYQTLSQRGRERAGEFTWENTAKETLKLFRNIANGENQ